MKGVCGFYGSGEAMIRLIRVTPAGSTQQHYIAGGLGKEEGQEKHNKVEMKRKCEFLLSLPIHPKEMGGSHLWWKP